MPACGLSKTHDPLEHQSGQKASLFSFVHCSALHIRIAATPMQALRLLQRRAPWGALTLTRGFAAAAAEQVGTKFDKREDASDRLNQGGSLRHEWISGLCGSRQSPSVSYYIFSAD